MTSRRRWGWFGLLYGSWLFVTFAYFLPAATWNPVSRFALVRSIVERGALSIDAYADSTGDRAFANDHWYSEKAPLPALLALPVYGALNGWAGRYGQLPAYTATGPADDPAQHVRVSRSFRRGLYVCSLATAALGGVLLGLAMFEVLRRRVDALVAFAASAATLLGTPLFPYATSFYGHTLAAAFLFGAVAVLDENDEKSRSPVPESGGAAVASTGFGPSSRRAPLAWSGFLLVAAVGCEYLAIFPALVIAVQILARLPPPTRWRAAVDLGLGGLAPALVLGAYHAACFGSPFRTGYSFIIHPQFAAGQASGLLGIHPPNPIVIGQLLFGVRRGLFYVAPIAALGVAALVDAVRRGSRDWLVSVGLSAFATLLLVNAGYYMWWGGAAAGPRHLVPALGFISVGIARMMAHRRSAFVALPVACLSMLQMLVLVGVGLEAPEEGNILLDYAWRAFREGRIARLTGASNWAIAIGFPPGASLGPLLAWWIAGGRYLARALLAVEPRAAPSVDGGVPRG